MVQESNRFLGEEKLGKLILKFSIPCVLSLLVSALYNIVDQIFIGNSELSTLGNAATGVVFPIFIIAQAFAWCFGDGCAAYLNICQGQNENDKAGNAIGTGVTLTIVVSLLLVAVLLPLKTQILTMFGASENTLPLAIEYFNVILLFFPLNMFSNMFTSVIRSDGSPAWAMVSTLSGAVVNIVLDPIFIFAFKWGMLGASWATVIGQTVSFIISFAYIFKTKTFKLTLKSLIPDLKAFSGALKLGITSFITQFTILIISLVCNVMLAKYGANSNYGMDIPIAVIGIESKVFTVVINIVVGIILGCQPIIGYNIGAKKYDRVKKLYKYILIATVVIGLVSTILFEFAPNAIISIFGQPTNIPNPDDYWDFAQKTFRIFLSLVTFTCIIKMTSIFFQSVGKPIYAVIASLIRDIVCFIPLILILPLKFGIVGILVASPCADFVSMIISTILTILYFKSLGKDKVNVETEKAGNATIKPSHEGVIITISREHGSCGKHIARLVAERLNIPCYYKELTAIVAQESGLDKQFVSSINENSPSVLHSLYLSTYVVQQAVVAQAQVIKKIAENGSCVIVGRAGDYVLRDNPNLVRVFIYAPKEFRIQNIMKMYGDSRENAIKSVRRSDEARGSYYKNISGNKWGDKNNYELMVDSSLGIEKCVDMIVGYVKG